MGICKLSFRGFYSIAVNSSKVWEQSHCGLVDNIHGGFGLVDNLSMTYEGNMLTSVCDSASHYSYAGATDFDGVPGQEYPLTYNAFGSLVSDAGRGIARIDYDRLNNPVRIQFTNGSVTKYIYSAAGEKLRVIYQTAVPNITVAIGSVRELAPAEIQCADSTDYLLGGNLTLRNGRIDKLQFEEGYCQAKEFSGNSSQDNIYFYYYDRDHLGNIRQVIKAASGNNILQTMAYYPFGAQFCPSSTVGEAQTRKYNGKEFDNMHGLKTYDYGARQYNPVTARWDRVDPLCEKYYSISPYVYCMNNPVMFLDPDGRTEMLEALIDPSPDNNIYILVGACLSPEQQVITTAHEAYGHGYLYDITGSFIAASHKFVPGVRMEWDKELNKESYMLIRVDTNKTLADRINIVVNQAKYNYEKRIK